MCKYTGRSVTRLSTIGRITKYRRAALSGAVGTRVRELVQEICRANDIEIVKGHVGKDHVHLFVSVPTSLLPCLLS